MTGEASAHAKQKFGAVKADVHGTTYRIQQAYNKLMTGLRHDLGIFARIFKFRCFHETRQTQNDVERFFSTSWPDLCSNTFPTVAGEF